MEQTFEKAATYIDREPYRSAVLARLARLRVARAETDLLMTSEERIARLRSAVEVSPKAVSRAAYVIAYSAIMAPQVADIARNPAFAKIRKRVAETLKLLPPRGRGWQQ